MPDCVITEVSSIKYRLPNGEEYETREAAERAYAVAELGQEIYDNTFADRVRSKEAAEYLLNQYTLTRKEN